MLGLWSTIAPSLADLPRSRPPHLSSRGMTAIIKLLSLRSFFTITITIKTFQAAIATATHLISRAIFQVHTMEAIRERRRQRALANERATSLQEEKQQEQKLPSNMGHCSF